VQQDDGKRRLPLVTAVPRRHQGLERIVAESPATSLQVVAPDVAAAAKAVARFATLARIELRLSDYAGLTPTSFAGRTLVRAEASTVVQAKELLAIDADFEVCVDLTKETVAWLAAMSQDSVPARLALRQPTYERVTGSVEHDADLAPFFARFSRGVPVEGVPVCILGRAPRERRRVLDTAMRGADGQLEIFRYTRRYILEGYRTKSLRCADCRENARCDGLHINYVRAHGYSAMQPV
jgi:hypothetical protein